MNGRTEPETVILFVGANAREKPSAELMKLLEGVEALRTDEGGTITVVGDDESLRMEAER